MNHSSSDTLLWTFYVFAFAFGAAWGSFLNVVIYRLPRKLSLVRPNSFCPKCETPIKPYDNVPIFGWLWLRGRCRACKARISPRYPAIETLVALLSLALAVKVFDGRMGAVIAGRAALLDLFTPYLLLFFFVAALVALFFIDLDITELPPEITLPGIALGLFFAWAVVEGGVVADLTPNVTLWDAALGAVIGGGVIMLLLVGYYMLTGRIGMGGGDIWMMAMVGAWVGWQGLLFVYLASSLQGIVVAVAAQAFGRASGTSTEALFRNAEVEALERDLGIETTAPASARAGSPSAIGSEAPPSIARGAADDATAAPEDHAARAAAGSDDPAFGKLAVPFGPFIALSALEYLFFGGWLLPFITGGVLSPNGFPL